MKRQYGFTLLELLIAVAIIAILFAIALPQYANYLVRSQVTSVRAEVGALKTAFDVCVSNGQTTPAACDFGATGSIMQATGGNTVNGGPPASGGSPIAVMAPDGSGSLTATFGGNSAAQIATKTITDTRDAAGNWLCTTTVPQKFAPIGCTVAGL